MNFASFVNRHGIAAGFTATNWLLMQPYFILSISVAYFIYRTDPEKFLPVGVGVIVWGLLSFLGFAGLTVFTGSYAPGLITALIYLPLGAMAARILRQRGRLTLRGMLPALACGALIMALPIAAYLMVNRAIGI